MGGSEWERVEVGEGEGGLRVDKFLAGRYGHLSRTQIQKSFEEGRVRLVGGGVVKQHNKVRVGEMYEVDLVEPVETSLKPVAMGLEVVYEDEWLLVINKGAGVVVHPGNGTGEDTLVHGVLEYTGGGLSAAGGELRPGVVHRLDKETSGLIVFAKVDEAYHGMVRLFLGREIEKEYIAVVQGAPKGERGSIKEPIGRHPTVRVKMAVVQGGRLAHTDWRVEERFEGHGLMRCYLHTGRTHQIRVHLAHIGHPIMGDKVYGYKAEKERELVREKAGRVMLHAERIAFRHPKTGEGVELRAGMPEDMRELVGVLR